MASSIIKEEYIDNPYYCQQIWLGAFGPDYLGKLVRDEYREAFMVDDLFENIDLYRLDAREDEEVIGVVEARLVVEAVVDHDPSNCLARAEVDLPPGVRLVARVERVATVLHAVDRPGGVQPGCHLTGGRLGVVRRRRRQVANHVLPQPIGFDLLACDRLPLGVAR